MSKIVYLVLPCYNEEEVLPETSKRLKIKMNSLIDAGKISKESRICFVDDGSKDKTWSLIEKYHAGDPFFCGVKLAHNRGHQNALLCGLMTVKEHCDCAISMDADLQDDINVIDGFIEKFDNEGCDIVYGVRKRRDTDTAFKRMTAEGFYKVMNALGVECVYNHADYRLMSRRALDALEDYKEVNLFLRGIVPTIGFKTDCVYYDRSERFAGESKYPLKKMLNFAWDGITSFSVKPLRFISTFGIILSVLGFLAAVCALVVKLCGWYAVSWTAIGVLSLWLLGGIQLIAVGVVGEYIGKIYSETKARPRFLVETFLH
ncbi:MAG: glycosyltransferase family 2 protein [Clostridia bacterium]|nr:glycosyltransferase family 2 protein [Clostridia bacterium]